MSLVSLEPALRLVTRPDTITQPLSANQRLSTGASTVTCQASAEFANAATLRESVRTQAADSISSTRNVTSNPNDDVSVTRRAVLSSLALLPALDSLFGSGNGGADEAMARERRTRIDIPEEMYQEGESGLRFYDVAAGKGRLAEQGDPVVVHFDVTYRSLTVVSSRQSKLLGGNRVISQPYEFSLGAKPGAERKREYAESANGLFSAQAAPKPPRALYSVVEGMREGGKRTVIVPPEQGYGDKGFAEIPPGATIQLTVELLEVKAPPS